MENNFSETLKQLRINAGYTQKQVYEMLNIRQSTFSAWETGRAEPSADMLLKLCRLYKVNDIFSAFGYDGYKDDGSLMLNMYEIDIIEKYRDLDPHGKEMVDLVLDKEYARSISAKESKVISVKEIVSERPILNAAHAIEGASAEDIQHDEDIMDDENF